MNLAHTLPLGSNSNVLAKTFSRGILSKSATGLIIKRNPPDTKYTGMPR